MTGADVWRSGWQEVGLAVRQPEAFAVRWRGAFAKEPEARPILWVLMLSASLSLAAYGVTMGLHGGLLGMLGHALSVPLAAAVAWGVSLPALYIVGTVLGSRLDLKSSALAALVALHFGAMARLASAPLGWFFSVALPWRGVLTAVHGLVFGLSALLMANVFLRVMKALDPRQGRLFLVVWLGLVALIDVELKVLLSVFAF
jgi:hypothetical protein